MGSSAITFFFCSLLVGKFSDLTDLSDFTTTTNCASYSGLNTLNSLYKIRP